MSKRTLDAFFKPPPKRTKPDNTSTTNEENNPSPPQSPDNHPTYPHSIAKLPTHLEKALSEAIETSNREGKIMNNQPDLDCVYFQPFLPRRTANELFRVLRAELPFYRVVYFAKRGGVDVEIKTPRFTTVFGVDEECFFACDDDDAGDGNGNVNADATPAAADINSNSQYRTSPLTLRKSPTTTTTSSTLPKYTYPPRPIPSILQSLKKAVESATKETYNFVLVNYYATGEDSIAFHSDDERFLGFQPSIASLSLGAEREFLLKHKPAPATTTMTGSADGGGGSGGAGGTTIKLPLSSGDMILMRGTTQANWLHSIPKRKGRGLAGVGGRINITFRRAVIPAGTDNYYHYNVGSGGGLGVG
ncbi:Oxoglutarate/iron-dependent dioxygenase [Penicillium waksmanii]|uniref:Oxoglutarate/iron-dependent dioxygenase n=1 Tax=Penicillium waksmanii TaxID=69791 RepID=UPI0025491BD7|nr:Oxoglutarate/iron-dependent dioxygenase [Penicillium waksmanii]KAJ5979685.1 Oxoglutarate/iron-dependent dioxygenase [Penicillium waksmanii]